MCRVVRSTWCGPTLGCPVWRVKSWMRRDQSQLTLRSPISPCLGFRLDPLLTAITQSLFSTTSLSFTCSTMFNNAPLDIHTWSHCRMKLPTKHTTDDEDWYFCSVVTNYKFNHHTFITLNRAVLNVEKQSPFYKLAEVQLKPSVNETCTPAWESFPRLQISICITNLCSVKHSPFFITPTFLQQTL